MNTYEGQVQLRPANDAEHAEVGNQLMGWAKTLVVGMVFVILLGSLLILSSVMQMYRGGEGAKAFSFLFFYLFVLAIYAYIMKSMLTPVLRIPKRQYLVADCIVMDKSQRRMGKGVRCFATVSYADGTGQKVPITTLQIFEKTEISRHAVVVWFLDGKGNPKKQPYSLVLV